MRRLLSRQDGQSTTEYMIGISVIVIAVVAAMYPMYPMLSGAVREFGVMFGFWFGPGPPDF